MTASALTQEQALLEGPPARAPKRIDAQTTTLEQRILLCNEHGRWFNDIRAVSDPFWYDEDALMRWPADAEPPEGADPYRARLFVDLMSEHHWYEWKFTKRRPESTHVPAYLCFLENARD